MNLKKLDKENKQKIIIEALGKGYKVQPALDLAQVKRSTYDSWIARDASFQMACNHAKALFINDIIPKAIDKDPFKFLQSVYPEYQVGPDTVVNIDNRPLINAPTNQLLQILKENQSNASELPEANNDFNKELDGKVLKADESEE